MKNSVANCAKTGKVISERSYRSTIFFDANRLRFGQAHGGTHQHRPRCLDKAPPVNLWRYALVAGEPLRRQQLLGQQVGIEHGGTFDGPTRPRCILDESGLACAVGSGKNSEVAHARRINPRSVPVYLEPPPWPGENWRSTIRPNGEPDQTRDPQPRCATVMDAGRGGFSAQAARTVRPPAPPPASVGLELA